MCTVLLPPGVNPIAVNKYIIIITFRKKIPLHGEELLAPPPTHKLEDHPLLALRDCLFNTFVATLHIGGRSSIRNLWTRHAVVKETYLLNMNSYSKYIRGVFNTKELSKQFRTT
jgi:hypothetical protein